MSDRMPRNQPAAIQPGGYDSRGYGSGSYPPGQEPAGGRSPYPGIPPVQPGERSVQLDVPVTRPVVSWILLGLTVLVFLGQEYGRYILGNDFLLQLGAKYGPLIIAGEYWRLITPVFLHANELHILFNMYALYVLGPGLERHYGHTRFLALYLISGFAGNVISFLFSPGASVGSSTAIFGLFAAQGVFIYQNRGLYGNRASSAIRQLITLAVINLVIGLAPGIDDWGHVGGLIAGGLFAWFAGPVWQVEGAYPNLHVVDKREPIHVQLATLGVFVLFAGIAFLRIMRG